MKLVFTWHSKNKTYTSQFSLRQIVSASVLLSLLFIVSSRSTDSSHEDLARIKVAQHNINVSKEDLSELKKRVDTRLHVYAEQLASLNHRMSALDNRNQTLASEMDIKLVTTQLNQNDMITEPADRQLKYQLEEISAQLDNRESQLKLLEKVYTGLHVEDQVKISGRPVEWGWLSSHYGLRDDPFTGRPAMHKGIDFAGEMGGAVVSTGAGIVTWAGDRYGYGLLVEIDHGHGLVTRYGHNSLLKVNVGDVVTKGDIIAEMGNTGRSTGVHVHYEVLKHGKQVDPLAYLR